MLDNQSSWRPQTRRKLENRRAATRLPKERTGKTEKHKAKSYATQSDDRNATLKQRAGDAESS